MAKRYVVHCGDVHQAFTFNSKWADKVLYKRLAELLQRVDFAPGLILRDEHGNLWKPKLEVWLEQIIKPEEQHGKASV